MIHLLDVNVLIALCDPAHPHHAAAIAFFRAGPARDGWATCPLVENGFLRIFGSARYPGGPGSPEEARPWGLPTDRDAVNSLSRRDRLS
jgi:predicted nucleic acid-binding protein